MRCQTWFWIKSVLSFRNGSKTQSASISNVLCLLLSWGGECSLGARQCSRRRWWRTWPPPPQSGWQPGRWGMCPAPCLAERQEQNIPRLDISALISSLFHRGFYFSTLPFNLILRSFPSSNAFSVIPSSPPKQGRLLQSFKRSVICHGLRRKQRNNQWDVPRLILFAVHALYYYFKLNTEIMARDKTGRKLKTIQPT